MINNRLSYPSDITNEQWQLIEPLIPAPSTKGRQAEIERREIVNGIFYMLRSGCSWRMLPHDLPVWQTVYHYYRCWLRDGTWQQVVDALHIQMPELAQAAVSGTLHHEKPTRYNVVRIHCRIAQHNTPDDEPKKLSSLGNA